MIRLLYRIWLLILFCSASVFAQNFKTLSANYPTEPDSSEVAEYLNQFRAIKNFPPDSIIQKTGEYFTDNGYPDAKMLKKVVISDSAGYSIRAEFDYGKRLVFGRTELFAGELYKEGSITEDTLQKFAEFSEYEEFFRRLEGRLFRSAVFEETVSFVLAEFEKAGYPFAAINVVSFAREDNDEGFSEARLVLLYDIEKQARIDRILIEGNTKSKSDAVIRESGIRVGSKYDKEKINRISVLLNRTGFYGAEGMPDYYYNQKGEGTLVIRIKEKNTNAFDGIIGYVPKSNDIPGYFTGFAEISLGNLFGTGRNFGFKWQKLDKTSQDLNVRYLEPWIFGIPVNLKLSFSQKKADSTYIKYGFDSEIDYLFSSDITLSALFSTYNIIAGTRVIPRFTVYNSSLFSSGVKITYDTRDSRLVPRKGLLFSNSYELAVKKITGPEEYLLKDDPRKISHHKMKFDLEFYQRIFSNQIAVLKLRWREIQGDETQPDDLFLLGGTNSLRGYREEQFQGNRLIYSNLEYRFLMDENSYAFLFFDAGHFLRKEIKKEAVPELKGLKTGYGLGLGIGTGLGLLNVSYALGEGDGISKGKIHFGIQSGF